MIMAKARTSRRSFTPISATAAKQAAMARYDAILVAFSGGKDSLACLLHLLDLGVDRSKIELWHHDVGSV